MLLREWSAAEVEKSLPWLRQQNAAGADIYIRPARDRASDLILIDDLDRATLDRLRADNLAPAVVVETSPDNFQAWLKLPERVPPAFRTAIAKYLAAEYGGDPASADGEHFGRLAGLSNRKPTRRQADGRPPFVLLTSYAGQTVERGQALINLASAAAAEQAERRLKIDSAVPLSPSADDSLVATYRYRAKKLLEQYGPDADYSRIDFMIARRMLAERHSRDRIIAAMLAASPAIWSRKGNNTEAYVQRTVSAAAKEDPDAQRRRNVRKVGGMNAPGM